MAWTTRPSRRWPAAGSVPRSRCRRAAARQGGQAEGSRITSAAESVLFGPVSGHGGETHTLFTASGRRAAGSATSVPAVRRSRRRPAPCAPAVDHGLGFDDSANTRTLRGGGGPRSGARSVTMLAGADAAAPQPRERGGSAWRRGSAHRWFRAARRAGRAASAADLRRGTLSGVL
ncbi:hypothetical protein QJS66_02065 [Kocuria rhizophila]|nr:hypothetical protein QJS66_02065 [Kocuria rhizophila]